MDISKLSKDERAKLLSELTEQERAEKAVKEQQKEEYKQLVDSTVLATVTKLQKLSAEMMRVKQEVFDEFATIIQLKNELFKIK